MNFKSSNGNASNRNGIPPPAGSPVTVQTAEVNVRLAFIRKVYALLTINFAITVAVSCVFAFVNPIKKFISDNIWIGIVFLVAAFAFLIVLSCFRLPFPLNLLVLYVFVLLLSGFVGTIVARYVDAGAGRIVLQAFIVTAAIFLSITLFVSITKKDFSFLYGFLGAGMIALILLIIFNFVLGGFFSHNMRRVVSFFISLAGALLMTGYLLYDTSLVINRLGPDDWLQGVISLYVDVTNLFLFLLNIFSFVSN